MRISFITTVFNEEKTIEKLLDSLLLQTKLPDEVIIVDGGSDDATVRKIMNYKIRMKKAGVAFNIIIKKGNRSVGRNEAIENAKGKIIVCTDAGNILDRKWIECIIKPFHYKIDVVAGYYKGIAKNTFEKCLIPYVLVMPDKINPQNFLPATRSMAFTKKIWEKIGGFDERYHHNEDYVFANQLKNAYAQIFFEKEAIAKWLPRNTYEEVFIMFFRFALGDAEAGIFRPKVFLLFLRYIIALSLIILIFIFGTFFLVSACILLLIYIYWSIKKNYRYVNKYKALVILPALQFTADIAVMSGTLLGMRKIFFVRWIGIFFLSTLVIFLSFRAIRNIFPIPHVNDNKIIGYAQYYGYPFYFDTVLFFIFLLLPFIIFFLEYRQIKNEK